MNGAYTNGHAYPSSTRDSYGDSQDSQTQSPDNTLYRERHRPGFGDFRGGRQTSGGFTRQPSGGFTRQASGGFTRQPSGGFSRQTSGSGFSATSGGLARNQERLRPRSRSKTRPRGGGDVLSDIKQDWDFMTEDKCAPVQVALQLLDESSIGLASRYNEFKEVETRLQNSLRGVVNEHHQGFSSSIGTFHQIQSSIQASQDRVRVLKSRLEAAKSNLITPKSEYQSLVSSSRNFETMLDILTIIEEIKQIPNQLEARISDKRFLGAVDCLQDGLRLTKAEELQNLPALNDLKLYLNNQEHVLTDILVEELHNHLYLKSPYCENRWTSYARSHYRKGQVDSFDTIPKDLYAFLDQLDLSSPLVEDTARNPEADSLQYIYMIIESLSKLDRLPEAIDAVEQRLPVELFRVVDRTNHEVAKRHPKATRHMLRPTKSPNARSWDNRAQKAVLEDLLGTLFARFEAIAEHHRALHEVVNGLSRRELGFSKPRLTRGFKELWKLYQSEMRAILHDYLSTDGDASDRTGMDGNTFRQGSDKDKKSSFRIDLVNLEAKEVKEHQDEIFTQWQKFVPGLVSFRQSSNHASHNPHNAQQEGTGGTGHRLLVEPDVFNISALLPASVIFIRRFQELTPSSADIAISTLQSFLHDFLVNVFQPQLEETLTELCARSYSSLDAFQAHPQWEQFAQKPVFKGAIDFYETLSAFCHMMGSLPHDQLFSQLVMQQINVYNERCVGWYNALVMRAQPRTGGQKLKASAAFSASSPVRDITMQIWDGEAGSVGGLVDEEIRLLLQETTRSKLDEMDVIGDRKVQASLCLLYTSMKWLALKLSGLRHVSARAVDNTDDDELSNRQSVRRTLTSASFVHHDDEGMDVYLPLSERTAAVFDGIVHGYRDLAEAVLRTLRLEMRCQALQGLQNCFGGSLILTEVDDVPSAAVLDTIRMLLDFNQQVENGLQAQEYEFLITGFSSLLDATLVRTIANNTSALNNHGATHITATLHIIYHNILKIQPGADLPRALSYLRLFGHGPDAIVAAAAGGSAGVPPGTFDAGELRALLRLRYGEGLESRDGEEKGRAREALEMKLKQLDEIVGKS